MIKPKHLTKRYGNRVTAGDVSLNRATRSGDGCAPREHRGARADRDA
jgi:hypothetical protein